MSGESKIIDTFGVVDKSYFYKAVRVGDHFTFNGAIGRIREKYYVEISSGYNVLLAWGSGKDDGDVFTGVKEDAYAISREDVILSRVSGDYVRRMSDSRRLKVGHNKFTQISADRWDFVTYFY